MRTHTRTHTQAHTRSLNAPPLPVPSHMCFVQGSMRVFGSLGRLLRMVVEEMRQAAQSAEQECGEAGSRGRRQGQQGLLLLDRHALRAAEFGGARHEEYCRGRCREVMIPYILPQLLGWWPCSESMPMPCCAQLYLVSCHQT